MIDVISQRQTNGDEEVAALCDTLAEETQNLGSCGWTVLSWHVQAIER